MEFENKKLVIVVSEDWSFLSHRLSLSLSAIKEGFDVALITKVNNQGDTIKKKGINLIDMNMTRAIRSPLNDLINVIKMTLVYKKQKPDVIHNVALKTILISSIAAIFLKKLIVVNAFTGLGYVFSSNELKAKIIRFFIKPVFRLIMKKRNYWAIFQNPDDMELFINLKLCCPERSVLIRGSGVDLNEFTQTTDTNDVPVVMLASRMLWDKGVGEFVEAAKRLCEENINAKFILVGDTDESNPMSIPVTTLKKWENEGNVSWEGHCNNMPKVLSSASIVCLPSYREGLPKVLLEAAAVGRPLIATDVPGCREIVKNGENGILVELKDVDTLYLAIKKLLLNKDMRETMGLKSRQIVESSLSTDIVNTQTLKLYRTALNQIAS